MKRKNEAEPVAGNQSESEDFRELDFVYAGQRFAGKDKRAIAIRVVLENGELSAERMFPYTKKSDRTVGARYRGAMFSEQMARGLEGDLTYVGRWDNEALRIEWNARHDEVLASIRLKSIEAEEGKMRDLENALLAARAAYDGMRKRYDRPGMAALEQAVLAALRTPVRGSEK